jgi:hypothetical protein
MILRATARRIKRTKQSRILVIAQHRNYLRYGNSNIFLDNDQPAHGSLSPFASDPPPRTAHNLRWKTSSRSLSVPEPVFSPEQAKPSQGRP